MSGTSAPFAKRLAQARRLLAQAGTAQIDIPADVLSAAQETGDAVALTAHILSQHQPTRGWRHMHREPDAEQHAYLVAAVLGCAPCPHLRRGGVQPATARLALERVDCQRCAATVRRPPATDDDRCDVCHRRQVSWFVPFVVGLGATMICGDACSDCARALQIEVAA